MALAQRSLGLVALHRGELMDAQAWTEQSLTLCEEGRDPDGIAWSMYDLGHLAFVRGELESAEPLLAESLTLFRNLGNEHGYQRALISLGNIARGQERLGQATRCYQESLSVRSPPYAHTTSETAYALEGLAAVAGAQRQAERAGRLFGAAEILRESFGTPLPPVYRAAHERDVAAARAQLDEATFAAAWDAGRRLIPEQAVAEALDANP
jgi:tetratricopeptide (TPR) repeat protein